MIMTAFKKILRIVVLQLSAIALSNVLGAQNNKSLPQAKWTMPFWSVHINIGI